jgi:ribonuclease D
MMDSPQTPPVWVDRPIGLQRMLIDLQGCSILAVDTESNSLFAYREQVCLIQFSTGRRDYLVDPLALADLSTLGGLFADPHIEKVFHAAEYDIICLKRNFGFQFANLFDTMVAARTLGRPAVGLGAVLEDEFGVTLDKRMQRANWGQRPLNPAMCDYARLDTFYLLPLRQRLMADLDATGRLPIAREDFQRLCKVQANETNNEAGSWWRISGSRDLPPQQQAVLQQLYSYRELQARQANLPPFKIFNNETLLALAQHLPTNPADLEGIYGLTPRKVNQHGANLLLAVKHGMQNPPPPQKPSPPRPDDAFLLRLDHLRNWRKHTAQRLSVESDVVLPKDILEDIACVDPQNLEDLGRVMESVPYRYKTYAEEIIKVIRP